MLSRVRCRRRKSVEETRTESCSGKCRSDEEVMLALINVDSGMTDEGIFDEGGGEMMALSSNLAPPNILPHSATANGKVGCNGMERSE